MAGAGQIRQPLILVGPSRIMLWTQEGYSYGHNSSGCWQRYIERGRRDYVDQDYLFFFAQGWECEVEYEKGGIAKLVATAGWNGGTVYANEYLDQIWELDSETIEKGLLEADFPFATALNLTSPPSAGVPTGSAATKQAITAAVNDPNPTWKPNDPDLNNFGTLRLSTGLLWLFTDGGFLAQEPYTDTVKALPIADYKSAYSLYKLLSAGFTEFPVRSPRIRHTTMFSNVFATTVSFNNVDQIISSAHMPFLELVPPTILFEATGASPYASGSEVALSFIQTAGDLVYGWKKLPPKVSQISLWKWKVETFYEYGLWPTVCFGAVL